MEYRIMHVGSEHWKRYLKEKGIFGTWQKSMVFTSLDEAQKISENHDYNTVVVDKDGEICY